MIRLLVKLAISGGLVWFLLRRVDAAALVQQIASVDRLALLIALALAAATLLCAALRWSAVLAAMGHPIGFRALLPVVLIGQFFSQILPTGIGGDVVRLLLARRL
ncbi:MAG TPA: lysylphosphatidylglycerol synthase domain-containing protein, partial [Stellaceae bacterium]|nr:lysylphosphatidylglycerol synthase domain-containing protein [Stellaceae bacterium]